MKITRIEFIKRVFQIILASLLGIIALVLGRRTQSGNDCIICPGNDICRGKSDCTKFLAEKR